MAKKKETEKVKIKDFKYNILNVKITSRNPISEKNYQNLFEKSFSEKATAHLYGEVHGIIRQLFGGKKGEPLYGLFCRSIKLGDLAMNMDNLEIVDFEIPKNIFPNPKEAAFIFYPDLHRIAIPTNSEISINTVQKLVEGIFKKTIDKSEAVEVLVEQASDAFDKIFSAKEIQKIHIEISPSNADTNKDATDFMDKELRKMGAGRFVTDIHPNATGKLNTKESKVLKGLFGMAASNGHAVATIVNNDDKKEIVNTKKYPAIYKVAAGSSEEARGILYNTLRKLFWNG